MAIDPTGKRVPRNNPAQLLEGVFKGGGSLGAAYPGMLRAMNARNAWFQRVAGTSAGAILAGIIAAGFTAAEVEYLSAPADMPLHRPAGLAGDLNQHEVDYAHFVDFPTRQSCWRRANGATWLLGCWHVDWSTACLR